MTTFGLCGLGALIAFNIGSDNTGYSFLFGSAGAVFYVRLLSSKAEAGGGGQGGPPSILVPVILFMALNRYNVLYSETLGVTLTPIPMLLGFFTYKPASLLQALRDIVDTDESDEQE